jgi:hypothetical protein
MKKLIVLVSALLLVSMVAVASDVTISGQVEQRWAYDYASNLYGESPEIEVKVDAVVDDNASLYIELEETDYNAGIFDKAHFTLDLGGIYDLPVGVTLRTGIDEYDLFDAVKITEGEYEDVIGSDWVLFGHEVNIEINEMIAARVLWANDIDVKGWSAGVAVTYDPVYVEVGYVDVASAEIDGEIGKGDLDAGAEFAMDVADGINVAAAAAIDYDLNEATADEAQWLLGAAVAVAYQELATLGIAFRGMTDSEANAMQIDVAVSPIEAVTIYLIAGLGLDSDVYDDSFDSFEGSVKFMVGPSTWYVGAQWYAETGTGIASEKADFVDESVLADSFVGFMRAELEY